MSYLPQVVSARYEGEHRIRVKFSDGAEGVVDFLPWLEGPVLIPLRDLTRFRRFFLDGGTVAWPNGADIAPEAIYEKVKADTAA